MPEFKTMIAPASHVELARSVAKGADPTQSMFPTALSFNGSAPADYYISTGETPDEVIAAFSSAPAAYAANANADVPVSATLQDCADMLGMMDISSDHPETAMARCGAQMVNE